MDNQQIEQLHNIISQNVTIDKRNIDNLLDFLVSMIQAKDINLGNMVDYSRKHDEIQEDSIYKNFQRLVHNCPITENELAKLMISIMDLPDCQRILSMDRTNWQFGEKDINVLTLSINIYGAAIPIFWIELDTKGCSNTEERKQLLNKFITVFGKDKIAYLLADREFVGNDWFDYLFENQINFVIRLKCNTKVEYAGQTMRLDNLFKNLHYDQPNCRKAELNGKAVYLEATVSKNNELVVVVSNNKNNQNLLSIYRIRWGIECMFKHLKSQGFKFENTHFTQNKRIRNLVKLLAIGFAICYLIGLITASIKNIKIKKHGYKLKSYFTVGINRVVRLLTTNLNKFYEILNIIFAVNVDCYALC
jgi:hypothetical protein